MYNVISKLCTSLAIIKDFNTWYSACSSTKGYMMMDYRDKRYAVKLVEITNPAKDPAQDLYNLPHILESRGHRYCPRTNNSVTCDGDCSNCNVEWEV